MILLYRIDNRLLHGQVLEAWIPVLEANRVAVVSDEVGQDKDRQAVMTMGAPVSVQVEFWSVGESAPRSKKYLEDPSVKAILLFARPHDVRRMMEKGGPIPPEVNVGGMHYAMSRVTLGRFMTFSDEDKEELLKLAESGVKLDARATPHDLPADLLPILKN